MIVRLTRAVLTLWLHFTRAANLISFARQRRKIAGDRRTQQHQLEVIRGL